LDYESEKPLRNVHVDIPVATLRGEGVTLLGTDLISGDFAEIPQRGAFVCHFDQVPILSGIYTINVYCTVNGVLADWVIDASHIEVGEGDFYASGKMPPRGYGSVLLTHQWRIEPG
jgi:lipopolysaccharide transport system ATP-binding protein